MLDVRLRGKRVGGKGKGSAADHLSGWVKTTTPSGKFQEKFKMPGKSSLPVLPMISIILLLCCRAQMIYLCYVLHILSWLERERGERGDGVKAV